MKTEGSERARFAAAFSNSAGSRWGDGQPRKRLMSLFSWAAPLAAIVANEGIDGLFERESFPHAMSLSNGS